MKINASPTKEFFISMLTRDISLDRAILDLIDNSVDAARVSGNLTDKIVEVRITENDFSIVDNCGGMDKVTALSRAFRFGRAKDAPPTPNSVGQFGVGMKRTLFKIGKKFEVISRHSTAHFKIDVDVNEWLNFDEWEFELDELNYVQDSYGLEIRVSNLNDGVPEKFRLDTFCRGLITEVTEAHFKVIANGLTVIINGEQVASCELQVKQSEHLGVASQEFIANGVHVRVIAGIGEREFPLGGWYIICNGRLVSFADKTKAAGWGDYGIPKYHPDYAYFRGIVDMEAEDSGMLPWTTTKTGVDVDNRAYRIALARMIDLMRPVLSFLRERAKEASDFKEERIEITPLNDAIDNSDLRNMYAVPVNSNFIRPEVAERITRPEFTSVQYSVPFSKMEIVKDTLGATSNKEAGLLTFDYYFDRECENE